MKTLTIAALALLMTVGQALAQTATQPAPAQQLPAEITIRLPLPAWNTIMQGLMELPMKTANPIAQALQEQAKPQLEPPPVAQETQNK